MPLNPGYNRPPCHRRPSDRCTSRACRYSKEALGASFTSEASNEAGDEEELGYSIGERQSVTGSREDPSTMREERARRTWKQKRRDSLRHVTPRRRTHEARPLLHPDIKKKMEGFFEHVKSTDPDQQINEALSQGAADFKRNAFTWLGLVVMLSVCNLVYHGLICWFMVTDWLGPTAWFLYAPTAAFYFIIAGVIWLAVKAVRDIEDGVRLSSLTIIKMWQSIQVGSKSHVVCTSHQEAAHCTAHTLDCNPVHLHASPCISTHLHASPGGGGHLLRAKREHLRAHHQA